MISNKTELIKQSVIGKIHSPLGKKFRLSSNGNLEMLSSFGGITYNFSLGDSVFGLVGDHVEPDVSIRNENREENEALNMLACIGNTATVISGEKRGSKGIVIGKHGVVDHILLWFEKEILENLAVNDEVQIKAIGQGLKLKSNKNIKIMNIDPELLGKIISVKENDNLEVQVSCIVPSYLIGSGIGSDNPYIGDFDIMSDDKNEIKKYGIQNLKIGDIILIKDLDCTNGICYFNGSKTVGIIVHSDCIQAGHGPGIVPIITTRTGEIKEELKENANIRNYI